MSMMAALGLGSRLLAHSDVEREFLDKANACPIEPSDPVDAAAMAVAGPAVAR
jgi:hypothetical protein